MRKIILVLMFAILTLGAKEVRVCDDAAEWPPFAFFERSDGKVDKSKLKGASIEMLAEIFKIVDLEYSIDMIPWKRCTKLVDNFDVSQKYEVFFDGVYSSERAEKYYITTPLYFVKNGIFYSNKKYPKGIPLYKKSDINKFKICDVNGYSTEGYYSEYGLEKDKKVDTKTVDMGGVLKKIDAGRCDLMIAPILLFYGKATIGKYILPKSIKHINTIGGKSRKYHVFISKKSPRAYELLTKINQAILILQNNGVSKKIFDKYLP